MAAAAKPTLPPTCRVLGHAQLTASYAACQCVMHASKQPAITGSIGRAQAHPSLGRTAIVRGRRLLQRLWRWLCTFPPAPRSALRASSCSLPERV